MKITAHSLQRGFIKFTRKTLASLLTLLVVITGSGIYLLISPEKAEAAWFDETWQYRQAVTLTVASSASDITDLQTLLTVDTSTLITAGKLQSSCQDLRFTNKNGELLPYYIDSGCNTSITKVWILADLIPKNTTTYTVYLYYGNPNAVAASNAQPYFDNLVGLVGYWPMNESSWTIDCSTLSVKDSSVNGLNAKSCPNSTGPAGGASGQFGNAGDFDGSNDYVDIPHNAVMNLNSYTVSAWIRSTGGTGSSGYQRIFYKGNGSSAEPISFFLFNGQLYCEYYNAGPNYGTHGVVDLRDSTWHFVTCTRNAGTDIRVYVDGVLKNTGADGGNTTTVANDATIGTRSNGDSPFQGKIDDVKLYNFAKNQDQITNDYNNVDKYGKTLNLATASSTTAVPSTSFATEEKGPTPSLYWKLNDSTGTTAQDSSPNNNDGTLGGTTVPTWQTEDQCINGKCLFFNGVTSKVTGSAVSKNIQSVSFWARATTTASQGMLNLDGGTHKVSTNASGVISATGFSSPTYYINGRASTTPTLIANQWTFITITTGTGFDSTSSFTIGTDGTTFTKGFIDEVKFYNYARTAVQISTEYNSRGTKSGSGAGLGSSPTASSLSDGLVGYWKMDETAGSSSATDSSGNGNTGTYTNGATTAGGKFGNAGSFDETNDYVNISDFGYSPTGSFSFGMWFKQGSNVGSQFQYIFSHGTVSTANSLNIYMVENSGSSGGSLRIAFVDSSGNGFGTELDVPGMNDLAWHHYILTMDSKGVNIYIDRILRSSSRKAVSAFNPSTNIFLGGREDLDSQRFFNGKLDEVRIYNRALSDAEVAQLYNFAPGPIGYWKMDEKNGQFTYDISGNANSATLGADSSVASDDPVWVQGKYGSGLSFDGVNDFILIADSPSLTSLSGLTINFWVKTNSINSGTWQGIFDKGTTDSNEEYTFMMKSDALYFDVGDAYVQHSVTTNANTWYYFSLVFSRPGSSSTLKIYRNGVDLGVTTLSPSNAPSENALPLYIGKTRASEGQYILNGQLDDFKIYSYARTPAQILEDMNAGHPAPGSPVGSQVAYWKMDEGYGTTVNDSVNATSTHQLTLSAAAWTNSGKFNKAWDGNGVKYLSRADNNDFDFATADDASLSMWVKSDSASNPASTPEYLISKGPTSAAGYAVYFNTSGQVCFGTDDDTTWGPDDSACSSADFYDNTWHNIVGVRATSTVQALYLYVDGKQVASDTSISSTATLANSSTLYVGDLDGTDNGSEFNGDIDEVKIYRSILTPEQVKLEYNRGQALQFGSIGNNASFQPQAAGQEYCIPGDTSTCTAPVGEWKFEEGSGTTANDTSGNGKTGTLTNGPVYKTGKVGKALDFDGSNDYVSIPNVEYSQFSVSAWIKRDNISGTSFDRIIVAQSNNGWGFFVSQNDYGANKDTLRITKVGVSDKGSTGKISDTNWHHVGFTYDGSTVKFYIDGVFDSSFAYSVSFTSGGVYGIGARIGSPGEEFDGKIDQVRIYNYIRTPAQFAYEYNKGLPIGWWKMDECQGSIANDASGNGNSGTITPGASGTYTSVGTCTSSSASSMWYNGRNGKINSSLAFDGTDDFVTVSNNSMLDATTSLTVSAWVKKTATNANNFPGIISSRKDSSNEGGYLLTSVGGTEKIRFYIKKTSAVANWAYAESNSALTIGQWYHLIGVWDGSTVRLYVNGVLQTTTAAATTISYPSSPTQNYVIGSYGSGANIRYWPGQLDDIRVYNYGLTPSQIQTLYNGGAVRFGPSTGSP